jgi:hypothetical protein
MDTDGETLLEDVAIFFAHGAIDETRLKSFRETIAKKNIEWYPVDVGDQRAGSIRV